MNSYNDQTLIKLLESHRSHAHFWSAEACFLHALSSSWPQSTRLSMCSRSSSQVITPGVGSGGTKPAQPGHDGYEPTSLHMSSQSPASLFCSCARRFRSEASHDFSSAFTPTCSTARADGATDRTTRSTAEARIMSCKMLQ